jgi:hypothetical protein
MLGGITVEMLGGITVEMLGGITVEMLNKSSLMEAVLTFKAQWLLYVPPC